MFFVYKAKSREKTCTYNSGCDYPCLHYEMLRERFVADDYPAADGRQDEPSADVYVVRRGQRHHSRTRVSLLRLHQRGN